MKQKIKYHLKNVIIVFSFTWLFGFLYFSILTLLATEELNIHLFVDIAQLRLFISLVYVTLYFIFYPLLKNKKILKEKDLFFELKKWFTKKENEIC